MDNINVLFIGFLINFILITLIFKYSTKLYLIDYPNKRKIHGTPVPIIGGLSIFLTLFILFLFNYSIVSSLYDHKKLFFMIISLVVIFLIGIVDDIKKLSSRIKIILQFFTSLFIIFTLDLNYLQLVPFIDNNILNLIFTILFILVITNSINLIDGLDNLANGLSIIILTSFTILFSFNGYLNICIFLMIIIGALLSVFIYSNFFNRIFLGDSGTLLLGWLFSIISLLYIKYLPQSFFSIPILVLFLPILDVIYLIFYRFFYSIDSIKKSIFIRFGNIFKSDRNHIHHHLQALGISNKNICLLLYSISILLSILAIYTNYSNISLVFLIIFYFLFRIVLMKLAKIY